MPKIFLGIGSNVQRHMHISCGLDMLTDALGELSISSVYESEAVGFDGPSFYNLAVGVDSKIGLADLKSMIKRVEDANGRVRSCPKFSDRTLDIDVLVFGNCVGIYEGILLPRAEVLEHAHVLLPLAEIAKDEVLPGTVKSFGQFWERHDKSLQSLQVVDFSWNDREISAQQLSA